MKKLAPWFIFTMILFGCDDNTVSDKSPLCEGITCSDHGTCDVNEEETVFCECDQGYVWGSVDMLTCVMPPDTCDGVLCNDAGTCAIDGNNDPYCECDEGYVWEGDNHLACVMENIDFKPVIYLYPEKTTRVHVAFAQEQSVELLTTYPVYGARGWCVTAHPDGKLFGCNNNREYYALYWEGITPDVFDLSTGFVVAGEETISFLEEKLALLGLTDREANEFIIYWLPILQSKPYNFIHFAQKSWATSVPLRVVPAPETSIRFNMLYAPLSQSVTVTPQRLEAPRREGFTLVEWGGRRVSF
ncbi:hypothetical protein KKF84_08990 [Myxococcota bacterium]|nr:hypothetical protein [Myxococcota bacterium]MBU1535445.1 hypothetical protein [Myxococcota bacterium]